jgi:ATP phosphoribosyltransferase
MLQVALPNKGALSDDAFELVRAAGYQCRRGRHRLQDRDPDNNVEFTFLRPRDIATYVAGGILDLGVTGRDLALDSGADVQELMALRFGEADFCYGVPQDTDLTPDDFDGLRIATSYDHIVRNDLDRRGLDAEVISLDGAVEISISLGVADAVADVVQTGSTLRQAGLKTTGDPIVESEAILVGRNDDADERDDVQHFMRRLRGIIVAREYVMVEYDVHEGQLDAATDVTPGIESPTVSPLKKEGWLAVKAMSRQSKVNAIMDQLANLGARGITVSEIQTCRI